MGFSAVNLPNVEASFIREGEIAAIPRNSGRSDAILCGIERAEEDLGRYLVSTGASWVCAVPLPLPKLTGARNR